MRLWLIIPLAAADAVVTLIVIVMAESAAIPPEALPAALAAQSSRLALAAVASYALSALLLATGAMVLDLRRTRRALVGMGRPTPAAWRHAFADYRLDSLADRLLDLAPETPAGLSAGMVVQTRFDAALARRHIVRLYWRRLAASQVFAALVVALALSLVSAVAEAALVIAGLGLAVVVAGGIVGAAADRLVAAVAALPLERLDLTLLQRVVTLFEESRAPAMPSETLLARYTAAIETGTCRLTDAVAALTESAEGLAASMRQSAEAIERASRSVPEPAAILGSASAELQAVSEQLGRAVRSAAAGARALRSTAVKTASAERPPSSLPAEQPEVSQELRQMLADFR